MLSHPGCAAKVSPFSPRRICCAARLNVDAFAPDEGETASQILSGSGSALVPDPTTDLDLAGYPGGLSRHHTLRTRRMEAPSELGGGGH
jgi:hypothetical protein